MDINKLDKIIKKLSFLFMAITFFSISAYAETVEITADSFFADEMKLQSTFTGNVVAKKGSYDVLTSKKLLVFFDKDKKPVKYFATNNVHFKVLMKDKHYVGDGNELTYEPLKQTYTLTGNSHLKEIETNKEIFGEIITVDQLKGTYGVNYQNKTTNKKPARVIFQIEDK